MSRYSLEYTAGGTPSEEGVLDWATVDALRDWEDAGAGASWDAGVGAAEAAGVE